MRGSLDCPLCTEPDVAGWKPGRSNILLPKDLVRFFWVDIDINKIFCFEAVPMTYF